MYLIIKYFMRGCEKPREKKIWFQICNSGIGTKNGVDDAISKKWKGFTYVL
jgi:hypothetical protein